MVQERLEILKAMIKSQFQKIEKIYEKIRIRLQQNQNDIITTESLAYQLHNLYCAYEDLFKIIADFFENRIEEKMYHTQLLSRMCIDINNFRPRLISEKTYMLLDELRSFRHLFRHAYLYELDPKRVYLVLDKVMELRELFSEDLKYFLEKL